MQKNRILCIGSNTSDTDVRAKKLANEQNIPYYGNIHSYDKLVNYGCYHTSLADMPDYMLVLAPRYFDSIFFFNNYGNNDVLGNASITLQNIIEGHDVTLKQVPGQHILYVGCSHTAGVGHNNTDDVFPAIVSTGLGANSLVCGKPGKGNQAIEDVLAEYNLHNQKVIVQFTDIFRLRYYNANKGVVEHKAGKDYSRDEYVIFNDSERVWEFEQIVNRVVSRLRSANSKFLFFQLSHSLNVETNKYMSQFCEFCYLPSNTIVDTASDNMHYGIKTQQNIASAITNKWKALYA